MADPAGFAAHVQALVDRIREPLGLDRWQVRVEAEALEDARACAVAAPEYRELVLTFDLARLETGDDVRELVLHEAAHAHTWPLHALAEELAKALAESLPAAAREPMRGLLLEQVRKAGELVTTDVGQTYHRLLAKIWEADHGGA